jgi:hypothetical protein
MNKGAARNVSWNVRRFRRSKTDRLLFMRFPDFTILERQMQQTFRLTFRADLVLEPLERQERLERLKTIRGKKILMNTKSKIDGRRPRDDAKSGGFNKRNLSGMLKQPLVLFHGTTFLAGDKKTIRAFIRGKR